MPPNDSISLKSGCSRLGLRKTLVGVAVLTLSILAPEARAERVYITDSSVMADFRVLVVTDSRLADRKVYFTEQEADAQCVVFITSNSLNADRIVYFGLGGMGPNVKVARVSSAAEASIKVFVSDTPVNVRGECGWAVAVRR